MFSFSSPRTTDSPASSRTAGQNSPEGGKPAEPAVLPRSLGIALCDASGTLTFLSPAIQELLGSSFGPEVAAPLRLYREDGLTRLRPGRLPLARARQGEVVTDAVICHRSEEEVPTYLRCNAAPVAAADGSVNGAVVFVEDVTAGHVGQQNQQRMQDDLIAALNHEFRTPLTKLVGHAEMLQDLHGELPVHAVRSVKKVREAADELCELADLVSGLADVDTSAGSTEGDTTETPEHLARARLRSISTIPLQLVASLDPVKADGAIAALTNGSPRRLPRSTARPDRLKDGVAR